MTQSQIARSVQHDWFISADNHSITAMDSGLGIVETFTDFNNLLILAGY